ncbi:hypothetical protein TRFO_15727 [Tritrichomonas foetus]|uniref:N-acetylgalactosaminide beta-1,3-galactosyltransferase n=1 Tax=Tritrichomonas foetus TaxID=1144522 RepID=A0A1J4KSU9_9EUKA|nr:hypothetical protein TRFO_15727 [Tritrichomonas foetus]|eukprot:OHT13960.1 hypothetical protein TRFO_15727 [Tritrichomonas foetus]
MKMKFKPLLYRLMLYNSDWMEKIRLFALIIPFLSVIITYLICYLNQQHHNFYFLSQYTTDKEKDNNNYKLHIGLMAVPFQPKRTKNLQSVWGNKFTTDSAFGGFNIMRTNLSLPQGYINLDYPPDMKEYMESLPTISKFWNERDRFWVSNSMQYDLSIKLISQINYFIHNTSANWFLRITDDVFINTFAINNLLRNLNENMKIDPMNDFFIGGHCLDYVKEPLLQGGSGFIFTRAAAKKFLPNMKEWVRTVDYYEDWHFARSFPKLGWPIYNSTLPEFLGLAPRKSHRFFVNHGLSKLFPKCPSEPPPLMFCKRVMPRIVDTIVWHDHKSYYETVDWFNFVNQAPDDLYWYQNGEFPSLCRK